MFGGGALDLDGIDDYVQTPPLNIITNNFTITAWVKGRYTNAWSGIIFSRDPTQSVGIGYRAGTGQLGYTWNDNNANTYNFASGLVIPNETWSFVAVTIEPSKAILYSGYGGLSSQTNSIAHTAQTLDTAFRFGNDNFENRFFNGSIDEVSIWNRTLSPAEIEKIYNRGLYYGIQEGNFTSQVIDTRTGSNFTHISWATDVPYQTEIGRAVQDRNNTYDLGGVNTSGLVVLLHFNNESSFGENDSLVRDFSPDVNPERAESVRHNATCSGVYCPSYNLTDKKLGAASAFFDGAVFDNLSLGDIDATDGLSKLTVSLWAYIYDEPSADVDRLLIWDTPSSGLDGWLFEFAPSGSVGQPSRLFWSLRNTAEGYISSYTSYQNRFDAWHHIVGVYDGSGSANDDKTKIYIDGVLQSTVHTGTVPSSLSTNTAALRIGGGPNDAPTVKVDEVAIWNRTLSGNEIKTLYKRGALRLNLSVRSCDDPLCDEETWSHVLDNSSGMSLNETITPINRYFQYRTVLYTENGNYTPVLYNISLDYSPVATDRFGDYNFTLKAPSITGSHILKVNSTWAGTIPGESLTTLRTLTIPTINHNFTTPPYPRFNQNTSLVINVTDTDSTMHYVNFTLVAPNGTKVINNTNGSRDAGDLYNVSFNLTSYGTWMWNVTVYDTDGFLVNTTTIPIIFI